MWLTIAVVVRHPDTEVVKEAMKAYHYELDHPGNWWFIGTENERFGEKRLEHDYLKMPFVEATRCDMCRGCVSVEDAMGQAPAWAIVTPDGSWFDRDKARELGMVDPDPAPEGRTWEDAYKRILARYPKHVVVYVGGHG